MSLSTCVMTLRWAAALFGYFITSHHEESVPCIYHYLFRCFKFSYISQQNCQKFKWCDQICGQHLQDWRKWLPVVLFLSPEFLQRIKCIRPECWNQVQAVVLIRTKKSDKLILFFFALCGYVHFFSCCIKTCSLIRICFGLGRFFKLFFAVCTNSYTFS